MNRTAESNFTCATLWFGNKHLSFYDYPAVYRALQSPKKFGYGVIVTEEGGSHLSAWVQRFKRASPRTTIFAQFTTNEFCNQKLEELLALGIDWYVHEVMSDQTVAKLYEKISGVISVETITYGGLILDGRTFQSENNDCLFSNRETTIMRTLMLSSNLIVPAKRLLGVMGYSESAITHTLPTHINRLRGKLKNMNLQDLIVTESPGYRLNLG